MLAIFSGDEILKDFIEVQEKKRKAAVLSVHFLWPKVKLGLSRRSGAVTARKSTKKRVMHVQSCCCFLRMPILTYCIVAVLVDLAVIIV